MWWCYVLSNLRCLHQLWMVLQLIGAWWRSMNRNPRKMINLGRLGRMLNLRRVINLRRRMTYKVVNPFSDEQRFLNFFPDPPFGEDDKKLLVIYLSLDSYSSILQWWSYDEYNNFTVATGENSFCGAIWHDSTTKILQQLWVFVCCPKSNMSTFPWHHFPRWSGCTVHLPDYDHDMKGESVSKALKLVGGPLH